MQDRKSPALNFYVEVFLMIDTIALILIIVGFFRELLGSGTLLGFQVIPEICYEWGYQNNGLMILPPMALIVSACIIWIHRIYNKDLQEK